MTDEPSPAEAMQLAALLHAIGIDEWPQPERQPKVLAWMRTLYRIQRRKRKSEVETERQRLEAERAEAS